jgi:hypothetical protein
MAIIKKGILGSVQGSLDGITCRVMRGKNFISKKADMSKVVPSQSQINCRMKMKALMRFYSNDWWIWAGKMLITEQLENLDWQAFVKMRYDLAGIDGYMPLTPEMYTSGIRKVPAFIGTRYYESGGLARTQWSTSNAGGNSASNDVIAVGYYSMYDGSFQVQDIIRQRSNATCIGFLKPLPIGSKVWCVVSARQISSTICSNVNVEELTVIA